MSDEVEHDETARLATLMELFHSAAESLRPGARYVMVVTDETMMLAFADHGGELLNTTVRRSSGPLKPHASNPGWTPPTWDQTRLRIQGLTGEPTMMVPPIIWLPGPGVRAAQETHPASRPAVESEIIDVAPLRLLPPHGGEREQ